MALAAVVESMPPRDPLLTAEDVAARLNVIKDWVWDHSSRRLPYLPVHPDERRGVALPGKSDRSVPERTRTGLQFAPETPVK
ncbi:MAG: hypothetical protein QOI53_4416 [Verrucomicrobiota bacterium]|jgi:hypothetical protein|nr:hypothetical protein [Verrucomicrobiota bacterium]